VFGIQSTQLSSASTIENIAAHCINALQRYIEDQPVVLAGWSFGGLVAHEMCRQLEVADRAPSLLALIDTYTSLPRLAKEATEEQLFTQFMEDLDRSTGGLFDFLPQSLRADDGGIGWDELRAHLSRLGLWGSDVSVTTIQRSFEKYRDHVRAASRFSFRPIKSRATIFVSSNHGSLVAAEHDWRPYLSGNVSCVSVYGDHYSMMKEPHVKMVSDYLVRFVPEACLRYDL